jgi:flagellar biosynthesis chaperone FliJ
MSRFPLSGLLRARNVQEEQARRVLGAAQARMTQAEQDVVRRRARLQDAGPVSSGPGAEFLAGVAARAAMAAAVTDALLLREVSGSELEQARSSWLEARMRARAIERLAERDRAARQAERARAEQLTADDLAGSRHATGGPLASGGQR